MWSHERPAPHCLPVAILWGHEVSDVAGPELVGAPGTRLMVPALNTIHKCVSEALVEVRCPALREKRSGAHLDHELRSKGTVEAAEHEMQSIGDQVGNDPQQRVTVSMHLPQPRHVSAPMASIQPAR
ncbi:hypothetical protein GCM10017781_11990 [Deinococcus metalli]|uniref:Uncharacterized protein n=1 Tax=Deinococcus metalli TaxID=1141878 RepID=A0ABQ3JNH7_9DEIO|nr:hypothetical protein GCM10017781_11990 [Deinococcus metalli]